jgi:glycosyltransferase involved in cell wall biosynthesis
MYDRVAKAAGLGTIAWFGDEPMPIADVFHAFNIDRPLELYPKLQAAHRAGRPFVLSTIHHPNEWLQRFRTQHPPSGRLGRLLYRSPFRRSVPAMESIKEIVRLRQCGRLSHLPDLIPSWSRRVEWLLSNAEAITLLSPAEAGFITKDFAYTSGAGQAVLLPNWVEGVGNGTEIAPADLRDLAEPPVLVVGRIEARKNVVRVCHLADVAGRHVVFLGRPNPNEPEYEAAMRTAVAASRFARWIPGVPRAQMAVFYSHAGHLLNASYVEVSPLVDIEALAYGCPVVTTRYALHHSLLPAGTPASDPYDDEDIVKRLQWRPARLVPSKVIDPAKCQELLVSMYHRLASAPPRS